jgi:hypothetical protein
MSITEKQRVQYKRFEDAGLKINWAALDKKFIFTVSAIVSVGVDTSLIFKMGELVSSIAESNGFSCELSGIVVFPIILGPDVRPRPDFVTYKRKDRGYFVGKNISFTDWTDSAKARQVVIAQDNLQSSILAININHLSNDSKLKLVEIIKIAASKLAGKKRS